jgi:hypothetical protein
MKLAILGARRDSALKLLLATGLRIAAQLDLPDELITAVQVQERDAQVKALKQLEACAALLTAIEGQLSVSVETEQKPFSMAGLLAAVEAVPGVGAKTTANLAAAIKAYFAEDSYEA